MMQIKIQAIKRLNVWFRPSNGITNRILTQKAPVFGLVIVALIIFIAIAASVIAPNDPLKVNMSMRLEGPSSLYWLGTDNLGRCIASRLIWGARMSLIYSLCVLGLMMAISIPIGLLSGYAGGRVDTFIMRVTDIFLSLPTFLMALAVAGMLGPSAKNMIIAMASVWWSSYARIIRGMAMQMKQQDFMLAAKAAACTHSQILFRHILRNIASPIIVMATLEIGSIILAIASFSFIGLGAQPPTPEWGIMLSDSKEFIQTQPQLMIYPGIAIIITVMAFNLLGEGLKNAIQD
ncbi:Nickel transport system permease protein NikC [Methanosarcina horonobensis HB-1 = JCM 15518]|uniref:Nickel transport system permease protein NikC n=2 Tax=Methanosarcina horonobensis TaxID=418008 RepID=A0A0E3SAW5_9EURY|nr:Nickel transport system permease protein NikC [Methanosarcina horonobensis HB-1 = JCM 15518]